MGFRGGIPLEIEARNDPRGTFWSTRTPGDLPARFYLMIDDFTAETRCGHAPLAAVIDRLDDLSALGINAIEFMPWTAWRHAEFD